MYIRSSNPRHGGIASNRYIYYRTSPQFNIPSIVVTTSPPVSSGVYVAEDGVTFYFTEAGTASYVTESF